MKQSTVIWHPMVVLTTTKTISRVFRLTSGEGQIVVVNICVILISFLITENTDVTDDCKNSRTPD